MILLLPLMVSLASSPGDAAPWQPTGQNVHGNAAMRLPLWPSW